MEDHHGMDGKELDYGPIDTDRLDTFMPDLLVRDGTEQLSAPFSALHPVNNGDQHLIVIGTVEVEYDVDDRQLSPSGFRSYIESYYKAMVAPSTAVSVMREDIASCLYPDAHSPEDSVFVRIDAKVNEPGVAVGSTGDEATKIEAWAGGL